MNQISQQKADLRIQYKELRSKLTPTEIEMNTKQLLRNLKKLISELKVKSLGIYHPLADEINIVSLLEDKNLIWCAPVTTENDEIQFRQVKELEDFAIDGAYGIKEPNPQKSKIVLPDAIILPGLAFDYEGTRLGYGKGCYDKYLHDYQGVKVAVTYEQFLKRKSLPKADFDESVNYVVTELTSHKIVDVKKAD